MKQILVSGSSAYDIHIKSNLDIAQTFSQNHWEPISLSTTTHIWEKYNGGTGWNIAYNLSILWEYSILLSAAWSDFIQSDVIMEKINLKYFHTSPTLPTASSMILYDVGDTKIQIFYSWAMDEASHSKPTYVEEHIWAAIVSANHIPTMLEHAASLHELKIPLIIDPAQQATQMSKDELRRLLSYGNILVANHFELDDITKVSGYEVDQLHNMFQTVIITYGAQWSNVHHKNDNFHIPAIVIEDIYDATGAWDSYRAWLLYGIIEWWDIKTSCQLWTILASYCVYAPGSQNHHVSLGTLWEDMKEKFNVSVDLYSKRKY